MTGGQVWPRAQNGSTQMTTSSDTGRRVLAELWGSDYPAKLDKSRNRFRNPLHDHIEEVNFGGVWSRPGIDLRQRCIVTIAVLTALNKIPQLTAYIPAAIRTGLSAEELREILLHIAVYAGLPAAVEGFKAAEGALDQLDLLPERSDTSKESDMSKLEEGRQIIADLMGEDYLKTRDAKRNGFNEAVQDYADEVCFGIVWSRPGIDRKQRSILNIAMLVALGRPNQLRTHIEGAINNGCTMDELKEILLHCAVYAGLPAAVEGFRIGEEVLKAKGMLD